MDDRAHGNDAAPRPGIAGNHDFAYYPPLSDNRYKGLIYWWTFGEQRADPDQLERYVSSW